MPLSSLLVQSGPRSKGRGSVAARRPSAQDDAGHRLPLFRFRVNGTNDLCSCCSPCACPCPGQSRLQDNGNTLIGCTLGNLVIEVDAKGKTVWQLNNDDLDGKPINDACGVQRLPNGNTVITSHHARANHVKLLEVTRDKHLAWTYTDSRSFGIHHFQILDTNGKTLEGRPLR